MKYQVIIFLTFVFFNLSYSQELDGIILVPANPEWQYSPYDNDNLFPRSAFIFNKVLYFQDSLFYVFSGYLTRREGSNEFSISVGDGGCVLKGYYKKVDNRFILHYDNRYCWKSLMMESSEIPDDTLSNKVIPMGGMYHYPAYKLGSEYYSQNGKSFWFLNKESFDNIKNKYFKKL